MLETEDELKRARELAIERYGVSFYDLTIYAQDQIEKLIREEEDTPRNCEPAGQHLKTILGIKV